MLITLAQHDGVYLNKEIQSEQCLLEELEVFFFKFISTLRLVIDSLF